LLFIDWISTPDHKRFNDAFLCLLNLDEVVCIVFSKRLATKYSFYKFINSSCNRLLRAVDVLKIISKQKNDLPVILLTYDPLLLPLIYLFFSNIIVFEHNTTPSYGLSRHYIWQRLFFRNVTRMAQYPSQFIRLKMMNSKVFYIGSPLSSEAQEHVNSKSACPHLFIMPSYRANIAELIRYSDILFRSIILVKSIHKNKNLINESIRNIEIRFLERIELLYKGRIADGGIITVQSSLRGTGWFNDLIADRIPILITSLDTKKLFEETFPKFPFIYLEEIKDRIQLNIALNNILTEYNFLSLIKSHNDLIKKRFFNMINNF
jgi:hypothetical protein